MTFAPSFLGSSLGLTGYGGTWHMPFHRSGNSGLPEAADSGSTIAPQARGQQKVMRKLEVSGRRWGKSHDHPQLQQPGGWSAGCLCPEHPYPRHWPSNLSSRGALPAMPSSSWLQMPSQKSEVPAALACGEGPASQPLASPPSPSA